MSKRLFLCRKRTGITYRVFHILELAGCRVVIEPGVAGWDSVMSAYGIWMGLRGEWPLDLHLLTRAGGTAWGAFYWRWYFDEGGVFPASDAV